MRALVTAIGSMSAECTVTSLNRMGIEVVATDIYDQCYHPITTQCAAFVKVPRVFPDQKAYCEALLMAAQRYACSAIIPLTDPEVDVLSQERDFFVSHGVAIWLANAEAIIKARTKDCWERELAASRDFSLIPTYNNYEELSACYAGEFVAKKVNGRSSEGILFSDTNTFVLTKSYETGYVYQPFIEGDIITVDFVRHPQSLNVVAVPRKECMRTKNGAGTVVEILDPRLVGAAVEELATTLNLTGVMNCEFIRRDEQLYLMDINPRFSAGVSFSRMAGYDFIKADVDCYTADDVVHSPSIEVGSVLVKRFCDFKV